jgi:hypothetical protein
LSPLQLSERPDLRPPIEDSIAADEHRQEVFDMGKTIAEELIEKGRKEGRKEGEIKTRRHTLILQLRTRFRKVPQATVDTIDTTTDIRQLDEWIERFATAKTLAQMGIGSAD